MSDNIMIAQCLAVTMIASQLVQDAVSVMWKNVMRDDRRPLCIELL